jgi:hypothetical protein
VDHAGAHPGLTAAGSAGDWVWSDVRATHEPCGVRLRHAHADAELFVEHGRLRAGRGYADAAPAARRTLARVGAVVRLRERGRYLLHASGVVDLLGRAWILLGDSGSGKSTLAYALAREGWAALGDDGVLVEPTRGGIVVHAWRDPLLVSRTLDREFPELRGREAEQAGDPRQRVAMSTPVARRAPLAGLLLLERTAVRGLPLAPVTAAEALLELVRQSPWVALGDDRSRAHLVALAIVGRTPAWRLPNGAGRPATLARDLEALA